MTAIAWGERDLDELVLGLLDQIREVFGTEVASILLAVPGGLEVAASCGLADEVGGPAPVRAEGDLLARIAAAAGPLTTMDLGDDAYGSALRARGVRSLLGAPLDGGKESLGILFVATADPRSFDDDEAALLSLLADWVALAIDHARGLRAEHQARVETEGERRRLSFLADASRVLFRSLDLEPTLDALAHLAVPYLADWCAISLAEGDGAVRRAAVAAADPGVEELLSPLQDNAIFELDGGDGLPQVIRSNQSVRYEQVSDEVLHKIAPDGAYLEVARRVGFSSAVLVPLHARGRTLGVITLVRTTPGRPYTEAELAVAEDFAQRAGLAVDNARLFDAIRAAEERQRELAQTLQSSLLPPHLPRLPGVDLAAVYHPAGGGAEVGGDFYDLFLTRGSGWAVVMGDVRGKGPAAAMVAALARYTLRTAAVSMSKPRKLLEVLNQVLLAEVGEADVEMFCTAVFIRFSRQREGEVRVDLCCGGHPAPFVLRADGRVEPLGRPGTALGLVSSPELTDVRTVLAPGDALVAYTDGVTEARRPAEDGSVKLFGEFGLRNVLGASVGHAAAAVAARLEEAVVGFSGGQPRDDIAVVVVRISD